MIYNEFVIRFPFIFGLRMGNVYLVLFRTSLRVSVASATLLLYCFSNSATELGPKTTSDGRPICDNCGKPGHAARHCPKQRQIGGVKTINIKEKFSIMIKHMKHFDCFIDLQRNSRRWATFFILLLEIFCFSQSSFFSLWIILLLVYSTASKLIGTHCERYSW